MSNLKTVQEIYEAFGKGDVPTILDKLSDNVEWEYGYRHAPNPVPWLQPRQSKEGVTEFFKSLGAVEFHRFTPNAILEGPGVVVGLIGLEFTVKETGKRVVETDEAHIWHFNDEGKVVRFRHGADTYQNAMAYQGQTVSTV